MQSMWHVSTLEPSHRTKIDRFNSLGLSGRTYKRKAEGPPYLPVCIRTRSKRWPARRGTVSPASLGQSTVSCMYPVGPGPSRGHRRYGTACLLIMLLISAD